MTATDEIGLKVKSTTVSGWVGMRLTLGVERCPNDFELELTERFPGEVGQVISAGDPCSVLIGSDVVITGYCDRVIRTMTGEAHDVRITGRGKCQDLVDASAEWPTCQINQTNILDVAQKLAAPYGITVQTANNPDLSLVLPAFNITLTDTPYAIIEEMARFYGVLAYEDSNGNLLISALGSAVAASGFSEGSNVQAAKFTSAADQRFSEYDAFLMNMQVLHDVGNGGNLRAKVPDPNMSRHRIHAIIAEAPAGGQDVALKRANWEAARRAGRGSLINVTVDSWRDNGGTLWRPNTMAPVSLPSLCVPPGQFCIGEVTFKKDVQTGTTAEVTLMPRTAFLPEPILLQPALPDLTAANVQ